MQRHLSCLALVALAGSAAGQISLEFVGRYESGVFDGSAAEILAYDAANRRLFVSNDSAVSVDAICIADPAAPSLEFSVDLSGFGGGVNAVSVSNGLVAVAVQAEPQTDPGVVVFFDTEGTIVTSLTVGALPDSLAFSPNGRLLVVANEGEPDGGVDPVGSVSIIRIPRAVAQLDQSDVRTAGFEAFDLTGVPEGVRVFTPGATPSEDLEPEFVTIAPDSRTAYVSVQEANALAVVDLIAGEITALLPLGAKDHGLPENALDASDRDAGINIATWPVFGLYQPDAIAAFEIGGELFVATANEGDSRGFEEERVEDLTLDPTAFPNAAALQLEENLGRLEVTNTLGDTDGDGDFDQLFAYGARSMSIFDASGALVWDSGSALEDLTAAVLPDEFNSTNDENGSFDSRSDAKGPEPEAIAVAELGGATYAFLGLERIGGIVTFDVSDPSSPVLVDYVNSRDFSGDAEAGTAGDLGPEGVVFIPASQGPGGVPFVAVSNEVSGTTALYRVNDGAPPLSPADFNGDGFVSFMDAAVLLGALGPCGTCACPTDLNGDGVTDALDKRAFIELATGG